MSTDYKSIDFRPLADGMRSLAERRESARPSEDVAFVAGELLEQVSRLHTYFHWRETTPKKPTRRQFKDEGKVVGTGRVTFSATLRSGTNDRDELFAEHRLDRAKRVLGQLKRMEWRDDDAKELRAIADELDPQNSKAVTTNQITKRLELTGTPKRAAEYIRANDGEATGDAVAYHCQITPEHFRKNVVPKLYEHGFYNNDDGTGYHAPSAT